MDINHATELLRHAEKIGRPAGDTPAVMRAAAAHIEDLERELRAAEIRLHDVATLCANVESELAEIKRRTYVAVTCNHVARMERAEARVAELETDAARYRYIRTHRIGVKWCELYACGPGLDAAIDAMMNHPKGHES